MSLEEKVSENKFKKRALFATIAMLPGGIPMLTGKMIYDNLPYDQKNTVDKMIIQMKLLTYRTTEFLKPYIP